MAALPYAYAVAAAPDEMWSARRWVCAKLLSIADVPLPDTRLTVVANYAPVGKNGRGGRPLRMAGHEYWQGLYCHASSRIVAHLPEGARRFEALVGVDSNEQTSGGRGSVVFSLEAGGKELFRSPVLHEGMPVVPVSVDLGGAREAALAVGDAGDGISCDQSDWADARVTLAKGDVLWLGDMAMEDAQLPAYTAELPFSFTYGGRPFAELCKSWAIERSSKELGGHRTEHTVTCTDPETGLVVRCLAVEYRDFPVVEWTLHLRNTGAADTPVIAELQALDTVLQHYAWPDPAAADFALHHFTGSICAPTDYEPHVTKLPAKAEARITAAGGRPTNGDLCYFNVEWPGEGLILGVGWPGQWAAQFTRDDATGLRVRLGQELTHFRLHPGEEVRSPLVALLLWKGDRVRAQNLWRRWMVAHNLPRRHGQLPPCPLYAITNTHLYDYVKTDEANQKLFIDRLAEEGIKPDYWWIDAGWYTNDGGWPNTGTWEPDSKRYPNGLRAVSDHAHAKGVKLLVWFEPERVTPGTWLYQNHPEWLLGPDGTKLLNLGDPEAKQWLVDHLDRLFTEQGIDLFRSDFNIDPLPFWRANDPEDRQGITENRYVEGYLAYWDELLRRHPDLIIDSCSSGGRRNDLETLRRALPFLRSDYQFEPASQQCHSYGIASWMPYYGTGDMSTDPYELRSQFCPQFTGGWDMRRRDLDYAFIRRMVAEYRRIARYLMGDYYPLTGYTLANDVWMAWQFDRPDLGGGVVQAFRRADSIYESARLRLRGLDAGARYELTNLDGGPPQVMSGRELMDQGLPLTLARRPQAATIMYRQVGGGK